MASLALVVSVLFLITILIGPVTYFLFVCNVAPKFIVFLLALFSIIIGLWWFLLPIPAIRYYGLIDIFIGLKVLLSDTKKKLKVDKGDNR